MTTNHTSGPWSVTKAKHGVEMGHYFVALVAPDRDDRALVVHAEQGDDDQGDANANLIAAAPELLKEAESAVRRLDWFLDANPDHVDSTLNVMRQDLRAAIAKARGAQ